jgi:stage IV sporulation protein FB
MFLGEPPATQADLHFRLFGFPVRVHPYFWVVSLLMGLGGGPADPQRTMIWIGVVFVSVLLHEMGHATMQRYYGGHPWITLYGFGGLASCNDGPRTPGRRIAVLLAGPGAGFLLAAFVLASLKAAGHSFNIVSIEEWKSSTLIPENVEGFSLFGKYVGYFESFPSGLLSKSVGDLIYVNVVWGLINLLPVFPLDGGQISRELFNLKDSRYGATQALQLSAGVAVLIAAYALLNQSFYVALLFGYLAYSNFQTLQFYRNRWR